MTAANEPEHATALADMALHLAAAEPYWQHEDVSIRLRYIDRRYFLIDELDAGRLMALRELVPALAAAVLSGWLPQTNRKDTR